MMKEFRGVSKSGAVCQAYSDLASRHRARSDTIEVLGVKSIPNSECKRAFVKQFHSTKLSFPAVQRRTKGPPRKDRAIIVPSVP